MKLPKAYYQQENVLELASDLLGKILVSRIDGKLTAGIITETEAYVGTNDKASHAYGGRRTIRTEPMYARGGISYVYLCYGIHHLFNIVTGKKNIPQAILIRAIYPLKGISTILQRRKAGYLSPQLCSGPGKVSSALNISTKYNATDLCGKYIWLEDDHVHINSSQIFSGPRIGVDYAGEDAKLPYRFWIENNIAANL